MKITFIVPYHNIGGGQRVIAIYAKLLAEKGHEVVVVSPNRKSASVKDKLKSLIKTGSFAVKDNFNTLYFDSPLVKLVMLETYRPIEVNDVPDADVIVATFWNTAEWFVNFPNCKGKKVYFIQHYEIHDWLPVERVKATLRQPFKKIVVAQWIADILANEYNDNQSVVVPNGVDHQQFHASNRNKQPVPTVGVMYSSKTFKGFDVALEALKRVKKSIPALKVIIFGAEPLSSELELPEGAKFYFQPDQDALRTLYGQCDVWLFSSRFEGFGLPILEAMACRTPVIGTRTGAAPDLINQTNGFLIDIDDTEAMTEALVEMAKLSNKKWLSFSENAYQTAVKHTWDESFKQFENALVHFAEN